MRKCPICCKHEDNIEEITNINLLLVDDIQLNNNLQVNFCKQCKFNFSDSNNNQDDYNSYYSTFNNYKQENYCIDKDTKCANWLKSNLPNNVNQILDYGSGNGALANLLKTHYNVEQYDVGMDKNNNQYDCLILSHVLEHIYDLNKFLENITQNINEDGLLYIEIPNGDFYGNMIGLCPLQEINIEHINFFSKYSLNKLLTMNNYYCITMVDDYFSLNNDKYYVIRSIFKKYNNNLSFINYVNSGLTKINHYDFSQLKKYTQIYVYGCGQFLFKILKNLQDNCNVINIVDDNSCYLNKKINNIDIINFESLQNKLKNNDVILLTTLIHDSKIKVKLSTIKHVEIHVVDMTLLNNTVINVTI